MSSICPVCGLPKELCVCKEITKTTQRIKITTEKKKFGKTYTIIEGFDKSTDLHGMVKEFKKKLACGGTAKDSRIELQGNHKEKVKQMLLKMNYTAEQIDVI